MVNCEKRYVICAFLFLGIYTYLHAQGKKENQFWSKITIWLCFILALLSKVLAVAFPVVLVLVDLYQDRSFIAKKMLKKVPLFLFAFLFAVLSIYLANNNKPIEVTSTNINLLDRLALASSALGTYFLKAFYPYQMNPIYPYPLSVAASQYLWFLAPLLSGGLWVWSFVKKKYVLFLGLGFFLINIALTLQVVPVGQGFKADRYTYLPYMGLFLCFGVAVEALLKNRPYKIGLWAAVGIFFLLFYAPITYQQAKVWKDSETLWLHQLRTTPKNLSANRNLADYYRLNDQPEGEYLHLNIATSAWPNDAALAFQMGMFISDHPQYGTREQALDWLDKSVGLDSTFSGVFINRAYLRASLDKFQEALEDLQRAERMDVNNPDIYLNRAVIFNTMGNLNASIQSLDQYLSLKPMDADKWVVKSQLHLRVGDLQQAMQAVDQGLQLNKNIGEYHFYKGLILDAMGEFEAAKKAVQLSRQLGYNGQAAKASEILDR